MSEPVDVQSNSGQARDAQPRLPFSSRHSRILTLLRYLWVLPATLFGLIAVALTAMTGGHVQVFAGVVESWGGFSAWLFKRVIRHGCALTIGHVIVGIEEYSICRYRLHEHVHIQQYEKWGPFFVPLYCASSLMAWLEGKHVYHDNIFEREAYQRFD